MFKYQMRCYSVFVTSDSALASFIDKNKLGIVIHCIVS